MESSWTDSTPSPFSIPNLPEFISSCPFTGSQNVGPAVPAALPEDAPYLLLGDTHHNETHSTHKHPLAQPNTHAAKQTLTDSLSPAGTRVELSSAGDAELVADTRLETHSDMRADTDPQSAPTEAESGAHSRTDTAILVQLQQVSAAQAANTERYEGTAGRKMLAKVHAEIHSTFMAQKSVYCPGL